MPRYQYAGAPATPPTPTLAIAAGAVTAAKAGTKYFWLQYRTVGGFSEVSAVAQINVAAGEGIEVTIPSSARPAPTDGIYGCDIREYVILMSDVNDPATGIVVAAYPNFQNSGSFNSLPATISLDRDDRLEISTPALVVPTLADLPPSAIHGMRRSVISPNRFLAYDGEFTPIGWKPVFPQLFSTFVASALFLNGSNRDLSQIGDNSIVLAPNYPADGTASFPVTYWAVNDTTVAIPTGSRVGIVCDIAGVDVTSEFVGLLDVTFQGYADTTLGTLDTLQMTTGIAIPYQGNSTNLFLQKDLPPEQAFQFTVVARFQPYQLNNRVPQGGTLRITPFFYTDFAVFFPAASLFGSFVARDFDLRRIVPDGPTNTARALRGVSVLEMPDGAGYAFFGVGESIVAGIADNTDNQNAYMTINGSCYVSSVVPPGTVKRAVIGTLDGEGHHTNWHGNIALDGTKQLTVAVTYPTAIRGDYPDAIAGSLRGQFNAPKLRIYVRKVGDTNVSYWDVTVLPSVPNQTFTIGSTAGTNGVLPTVAANFGLYAISESGYTLGSTNAASTFDTANYEVAIATLYENTVTRISHAVADGCIYEADATLAELFDRTRYYGTPVNTPQDLRNQSIAAVPDLQFRTVRSRRKPFQWDVASMGIDDGTDSSKFLRPVSIGASDPGRWAELNRVDVGTVSVAGDGIARVTTTEGGGVTLFNFELPTEKGEPGIRGRRGPAGTIAIGNVDVGLEGDAKIANRGTANHAILDFVLPLRQGLQGRRGKIGPPGPPGSLGSNSGVVIDSAAAPTTAPNQIAIFNASGSLRLRRASNGADHEIPTLGEPQIFTRGVTFARRSLVWASTITIDANEGNMWRVILQGATTIANPINPADGQVLNILFVQDATGGRIVFFDTKFAFSGGSAFVPTMPGGSIDLFSAQYDATLDKWLCNFASNYL